jgi:predicted secreted hydrolase
MRPPGRAAWLLAVAAALALAAAAWWVARPPAPPPEARATLSLIETLGGADTAGYARAVEPRPFVFPDDHGAHPDFRTEWWYLTGNLWAADGRRFGVQLTIFRSALAPASPPLTRPPPSGTPDAAATAPLEASVGGPSSWATRQAYMAHLAVTDVSGRRFHAFERFARGAVGLAGATADPLRVWVDDWRFAGASGGTASRIAGGDAALDSTAGSAEGDPALDSTAGTAGDDPVWPLTAQAAEDGTGLSLVLTPIDGVALQGDRGLSRKGPDPGDASYYYAFPRLAAEGTVSVEGREVHVRGEAWLDREWSTSVLPAGVVGWDWFALQLGDGRELMVYRLRDAEGGTAPWSAGLITWPAGRSQRLEAGDFSIAASGEWRSPVDGAPYPSGWRLRVPSAALDLQVEPVLADQELDLAFRYWEGAVDVRATDPDRPLTGVGYVELTGYAGAAPPGRGDERDSPLSLRRGGAGR